MVSNLLPQERATYHKEYKSLLKLAPGRFVLIHKRSVLGTFATWQKAVDAGYERIGLKPFLVLQILQGQACYRSEAPIRRAVHSSGRKRT